MMLKQIMRPLKRPPQSANQSRMLPVLRLMAGTSEFSLTVMLKNLYLFKGSLSVGNYYHEESPTLKLLPPRLVNSLLGL